MRTFPIALILVGLLGCAHSPGLEGADGLRKVAETFFRDARWKDYVGAAALVTPARRDAFTTARRRNNDDRDFSVVDFEIEQIKISKDTTHGKVVARMSWTRLPSLSVHTHQVTAEFVKHKDDWLLVRLDRGPFPTLTGAPPAATP